MIYPKYMVLYYMFLSHKCSMCEPFVTRQISIR